MSLTSLRVLTTGNLTATLVATAALLAPLGLPRAAANPASVGPPQVSVSWCTGDLAELDNRLRATGFSATAAHHLADITRNECSQ
jgi:hypothetical protein